MDMATALDELGVTDVVLEDEIRESLDRDGFVPLPGILPPAQLDEIRTRLAELSAAEGEKAGIEVHQEAGTDRLADLINKDPLFDIVIAQPRVLAAIHYVLGEFKLSSLNSRAALPGHGHQALHTDWPCPVPPGEYQVCNSLWLLDDIGPHNGATRLVPGSHRSSQRPADAMADPAESHPDQIILEAPAGTVVVFNSHVWHGGTGNPSDKPRRIMHGYFVRREHTQQLDQKAYIRPETRARLSRAAQFILDV